MEELRWLRLMLFGCLVLSAVLCILTYTPVLASVTFVIVLRIFPVIFAILIVAFYISFGPFFKEKD